MFGHTIPVWLQFFVPSVTWKVKTTGREVYFTFDDGPHPEITDWVLDQLHQFNAKATFFFVGANVERYPEIFKKVAQAGHVIGNHTFHHLNGWAINDQAYYEDIERGRQVTGSTLFRPPYGRIRLRQIRHLKQSYRIIQWNLLTGDYNASLNPEKAFRIISRNMTPGSILVFHDSVKAEKNLKILLPQLLAYAHEKGFTFAGL